MAIQKSAPKQKSALTPKVPKRATTAKDISKLAANISALLSRRDLASKLGNQFSGDRSLYDVLGYERNISFDQYMGAYERGDIAARIIDAAPISTWRRPPILSNDSDPNNFTDFEKAWSQFSKKRRVFHYLERVDKLAGIGHYGLLLIGSSDVRNEKDMARPMARLKSVDDILYLTPFTEGSADIASVDNNPKSERFGLPDEYTLTVASNGTGIGTNQQIQVHWSRVVHVAEGLREDDIYGTPRLRAVFNRLYDVDKIAGGSAEIFWQAAKRIMILESKEGFNPVDDNDALTEMMDELIHGLRRVIDVNGYSVETLEPSDVKPDEAFRVSLALISSATGIPQRILLGSEQGKMASTQDEVNWNGKIADRQLNFAEPVILRQFVDRLIRAGALPSPESDYVVTWPTLFEQSDKEKAQIGLLKARSIAQYMGKAGENLEIAQQIVPLHEFRGELLNLRAQKIETAIVDGGGQSDDPNKVIDVPAPIEAPAANVSSVLVGRDGTLSPYQSQAPVHNITMPVHFRNDPVNINIPEREMKLQVHINIPDPKVDVHIDNKSPDVRVQPADVVVNVPKQSKQSVRYERDANGLIVRQVVEDEPASAPKSGS